MFNYVFFPAALAVCFCCLTPRCLLPPDSPFLFSSCSISSFTCFSSGVLSPAQPSGCLSACSSHFTFPLHSVHLLTPHSNYPAWLFSFPPLLRYYLIVFLSSHLHLSSSSPSPLSFITTYYLSSPSKTLSVLSTPSPWRSSWLPSSPGIISIIISSNSSNSSITNPLFSSLFPCRIPPIHNMLRCRLPIPFPAMSLKTITRPQCRLPLQLQLQLQPQPQPQLQLQLQPPRP